jgi:hypothetical protein
VIGLEKVIDASGDIDQDFEIIKEYYQDKVGKYPEKQGEIRIKVRRGKTRQESERSGGGE